MNREVDFVVVGEFSRAGLFHLHGVFDLAPEEYEDAKAAFRLACGKWSVESRNRQFKLRPMPDQGWLGYMIKDTTGLKKNLPSVTRNLGRLAMHEHSVRNDSPKDSIGSATAAKPVLPYATSAPCHLGNPTALSAPACESPQFQLCRYDESKSILTCEHTPRQGFPNVRVMSRSDNNVRLKSGDSTHGTDKIPRTN